MLSRVMGVSVMKALRDKGGPKFPIKPYMAYTPITLLVEIFWTFFHVIDS